MPTGSHNDVWKANWVFKSLHQSNQSRRAWTNLNGNCMVVYQKQVMTTLIVHVYQDPRILSSQLLHFYRLHTWRRNCPWPPMFQLNLELTKSHFLVFSVSHTTHADSLIFLWFRFLILPPMRVNQLAWLSLLTLEGSETWVWFDFAGLSISSNLFSRFPPPTTLLLFYLSMYSVSTTSQSSLFFLSYDKITGSGYKK